MTAATARRSEDGGSGPRRWRWPAKAALACGATAVVLLLAEGYFQVRYPWGYAVSTFQHRKALAADLHIGALGNRVEFAVPLRKNELGLHGAAVEIEKRAGCRRVLILGDSFIEALQVPESQRFSALLQARLDAELDGCFEVLAVGLSGSGQRWQNEFLESWLDRLGADLVLSSFLLINDVRDNDEALEQRAAELYTQIAEGDSWADRGAWAWLDRSKLFGFVRYHARRTPGLRALLGQQALKLRFRHLNWAAQADPLPSAYVAAWRTTEELFAETKRLIEPEAELQVVALPYQARFEVEPGATVVFDGQTYTLNPDRAFQRLEDLVARLSIPYTDLLPCFRRRNPTGASIKWRDDGHWNVLGNRLAADCFFEIVQSWARKAPARAGS